MLDDYKCTECGFVDEYSTKIPSMRPPEVCTKCGKGKMERTNNMEGGFFKIFGWCYANTHGKYNWKAKMSASDQAKVLTGEKDPY